MTLLIIWWESFSDLSMQNNSCDTSCDKRFHFALLAEFEFILFLMTPSEFSSPGWSKNEILVWYDVGFLYFDRHLYHLLKYCSGSLRFVGPLRDLFSIGSNIQNAQIHMLKFTPHETNRMLLDWTWIAFYGKFSRSNEMFHVRTLVLRPLGCMSGAF